MDLDWHLLRISEEDATSSQPPPPNPIADARPRKKKARTLRETDWGPYKERIIQLHHVEKRPLPEVRILMEQEFGFTAEIRQYRSRLTQWKLDKNIKPDEMKAIVRHRQQRDLIETSKPALKFRVRGQEVEPHKIERWMKRHEIEETLMHAPSPVASTPSAVSYATMSEISSPGIHSMLSPGFKHDVYFTTNYTPTTPRQSISSSPSTPRQIMDNAPTLTRSVSTDPLLGPHVTQVDDEHFFARWRHSLNHYGFGTRKGSDWRQRQVSGAFLYERNRGLRPKLTIAQSSEREAIEVCRYITEAYIYGNSPAMIIHDDRLQGIDLIIYIYRKHHTEISSVRFMAEGTHTQDLEDRVMGFDLDTGRRVWTIRFPHEESWMDKSNYFNERLHWHWVNTSWSELQPFTWPSNDDDVERTQFYISHFGEGAAGK